MKKQLNVFIDATVIDHLDVLVKFYQPKELITPTRPLYIAQLIEREYTKLQGKRLGDLRAEPVDAWISEDGSRSIPATAPDAHLDDVGE